MIDRNEIDHLAALARLNLTEEEKERLAGELGNILSYIGKLSQLDVAGVEPMAGALPVTNVMRDDIEHVTLERRVVMANAPDPEGGFFKVPRIIEEEGGDDDAAV